MCPCINYINRIQFCMSVLCCVEPWVHHSWVKLLFKWYKSFLLISGIRAISPNKFHLKGLKATVQVFPNSDWGQAGPVRKHPSINLNDKIFKMIRAAVSCRKLTNLLYPVHIFYSHWWAVLTIGVVTHGAASTAVASIDDNKHQKRGTVTHT